MGFSAEFTLSAVFPMVLFRAEHLFKEKNRLKVFYVSREAAKLDERKMMKAAVEVEIESLCTERGGICWPGGSLC